MKNLYVGLVILFLLSACAPTTKGSAPQPAAPIIYEGTQEAVYAVVTQSITTAQGLDGSDGWIIAQSDAAGGFIRAETFVTYYILNWPQTPVRVVFNAIVTSNGDSQTQVIIQGTEGSESLARKVIEDLNAKFLRL